MLFRGWHTVLRGPRAVLQVCAAPFKLLGQLFARTVGWWSRRESKYLLRGVPSMVVFAGAAYLAVACRLQSDAALADRYLAAAKGINDAKAKAKLYERIVLLRPQDDEVLFEFAQRSSDAGDDRRAQVILQKLAPLEGQGYAEAQKVRGRQYLAWQHLSHEYFERAEQHLKNAKSLKPGDPETHALLGTLYFASGNRELAIGPFEDALKIGEQTGGELPGYLQPIRLSLAIAYASARVGNLVRAKNLDRAKELATRAQAYYQDRVNRDPTEDIEARVYLAETQLFLEEFAAGAETLRVGRSLHPNDESLRAATARFNVAWYDALEQPGNGIALTGSKEGMDAFDKLELLSAALQMDPNYFPIFDRMMGILTQNDESSEIAREKLEQTLDERARVDSVKLEESLVQGRAVGLTHLLLGSAAFELGNPHEAEFHLQQAANTLPNAAIVQNNLAWCLAFRDPPDLDRALRLVNDVLQRFPDDGRFLDTRGQIYTKLERWDEAIDDLEKALEKSDPGWETHAALAKCYDSKGFRELAQQHERLAAPALGE